MLKLGLFIGIFSLLLNPLSADSSKPVTGLELYGNPKYPQNFKHFEYVNPKAPKDGTAKFTAIGTFDSLNPFTIKGSSAAGIAPLHPSYFYATLLAASHDEPFSHYAYIAESMVIAPDKASVTFNLRKNATFHDGTPITPEDVVFTFNTLKQKGLPFYKTYYKEVLKAEKTGLHQVKFTFQDGHNKELPLIIGEIPIISKHYYSSKSIDKASLDIPVGSGPYRIESIEPGQTITFKRAENWWGDDIPAVKGFYNFDRLIFTYFRDGSVAFEAFKAGDADFRVETIAKNWMTGYDFPAVREGKIIKLEIKDKTAKGMQGLFFNTRREVFKDPRVRHALSLLYDFEWVNRTLFYGLYKRTNSYFSNSVLASRELPSGEELEVLNLFRDQLPEKVFTQPYKLTVNDGSGSIRAQLHEAKKILTEAGYQIQNQKMVNIKTGKPLAFEILIADPAIARTLNSYVRNLERLGITATLRVVDPNQFVARIEDFDYDAAPLAIAQSESPGNEQLGMWGSKSASIKGSQNYAGVEDPVVDELINLVLAAQSRESLIQRTRALDRVLLWKFYVVPFYYSDKHLIAFWNRMKHPKTFPSYYLTFDTWWEKPSGGR